MSKGLCCQEMFVIQLIVMHFKILIFRHCSPSKVSDINVDELTFLTCPLCTSLVLLYWQIVVKEPDSVLTLLTSVKWSSNLDPGC